MRALCPVCRNRTPVRKDGTVGKHRDGIGKECVMVGNRPAGWNEESTTAAVAGRSGGICEYCQRRRATDRHHRMSRGVGGVWTPANIIHLCRVCHMDVTNYPAWAHGMGLVVKSHEIPGDRPVTREDGTQFQPTDNVTK